MNRTEPEVTIKQVDAPTVRTQADLHPLATLPGLLVTLDGPDFSGKTTLASRLVPELRIALDEAGSDREVIQLREPGGTPAGEAIRRIVKHPEARLVPRAELLLFAAARAQLMAAVVYPALAEGHVVVLDRYIESTLVYQGDLLGVDDVMVAQTLADAILPDVSVVLLPAPDVIHRRAVQRQHAGGETLDAIEADYESDFRRMHLRNLYLDLPMRTGSTLVAPWGIRLIETSESPSPFLVSREILGALDAKLAALVERKAR